MKLPILGSQTFLTENKVPVLAFEKAMNKRYTAAAETTAEAEQQPMYTGRYIVLLRKEFQDFGKVNQIFTNKAGLKVASFNDFSPDTYSTAALTDVDVLTYNSLGVALISGEDHQIAAVADHANHQYLVLPETIAYVPDDLPSVNDTANFTWGLNATNAIQSQHSGKGVKVSILDTGFDQFHPDFAGRIVTAKSFVDGDPDPADMHGHGTHCIGTACGNVDINGLRYGVAPGSEIYAGKVLSNAGSGAQEYILNGILWATEQGCKVISMSIESRIFPGQGYDLVYERFAQDAMSKGAILVAAAGNRSYRSVGYYNPVGSPADCPSILSVAALDANMNIADFSNRSINPNSQIDISGPGVDVYSTWPMPKRYRRISGTSMATPHVAGILALLWEKYPNATPAEITLELLRFAKRLPLPSIDAGSGLVMAP